MIFNLAMDMKNALNFPKKTEFENIEKINLFDKQDRIFTELHQHSRLNFHNQKVVWAKRTWQSQVRAFSSWNIELTHDIKI